MRSFIFLNNDTGSVRGCFPRVIDLPPFGCAHKFYLTNHHITYNQAYANYISNCFTSNICISLLIFLICLSRIYLLVKSINQRF